MGILCSGARKAFRDEATERVRAVVQLSAHLEHLQL